MKVKSLKEILKIRNEKKGDILIHVSDTPSISLGYVKRVVEKLGAKYLVHTGDFIDELKTTHPLFEKRDYERALVKFINKLEKIYVEEIYLVPGNHDYLDILKMYNNRFKILEEGSIINISKAKLSVAHDYKNLKEVKNVKNVFYLYGHNKHKNEMKNYLNGFCQINIIFMDDLEVYQLSYPFYVDIVRGKDRIFKSGL